MNIIRLLLGHCITVEGFAMNDFETMNVGNVASVSGETTNNAGCDFDPVIFTIRPQ
jgi:hypothetical protein